MQTIMNEDRGIYGFEKLYDSMMKCKKGVLWKNEVARFSLNGIEEILKLENELQTNSYKPRKTREFKLLYPKERDVVSTHFRDRIPQRSLNDNILYPILTKDFIYTNFACQVGKGTDLAREYLIDSLRSMTVNHKNDFYLLKCDFKGYYKNLKHAKVNAKLNKKLDDWTFNETINVLERQYKGDTGYNPGSQMVQIVGISFPSNLDHFIKERLRIKYYMRYMDDFILIHENKEYLKYCARVIETYAVDEGLILHPNKTKIYNMAKEKVRFLGFDYTVTNTGKVLMTVSKQNVKHEKKKLRKLVAKAKRGEMIRAHVDECYKAWKAHASKGKHYKLFVIMDRYYKELWRNDGNGREDPQNIKCFDRRSTSAKKSCK